MSMISRKNQVTLPIDALRAGFSPPEGSILVVGGRIGILQRDGVYITLEASDDDLLLATARALEPLPGS